MQWNSFDPMKGFRQKLPAERRDVLVHVKSRQVGCPNVTVVGYLRFAAGDKDSPQFIMPGLPFVEGAGLAEVLAWSDCLPEAFESAEAATILPPSHKNEDSAE